MISNFGEKLFFWGEPKAYVGETFSYDPRSVRTQKSISGEMPLCYHGIGIVT
jgi:hypothetical protein